MIPVHAAVEKNTKSVVENKLTSKRTVQPLLGAEGPSFYNGKICWNLLQKQEQRE